ncbi:MAG: hypothetical protein J6B85_09320 [Lachnospiraceae bacterium]|nr:hypothetical protein [Lachnospiraceae bacterium]
MENRIRGITALLLVWTLLIGAGCGNTAGRGNESTETGGTTQAVTEAATDAGKDNLTVLPPEPDTGSESGSQGGDSTGTGETETTAEMVKVYTLPIYTLNVETLEPEAVSVLIQATEITPELIVDKVIETLEDQGYTIEVESVTTQEDAVVVSFYKDQPPVTFGSSAEGAVLDVFAQSLVDNLEDYSKVIYRMEGEAYASGHFEFGINQVYLEDTRRNTK